jgi:integrase
MWVFSMRELNALQVRQKNIPGRYRCGDCLWLQVTSSNTGGVTKSWLLRYVIGGRERVMGLGSLRRFSLQEARARARRHLQMLADGIDPLEARREQRDARRAQVNERMLFKEAVARFLGVHVDTWKNARHRQQWSNTLRDYAGALRDRPVSAIDGAVITDALSPIWTTIPVTARRVKQRIERVVQWVKDGMPLPMHGVAGKRVKHHAALPFAEIPAFMAKLRAKDTIAARVLELTILTASRTSEITGARWDEVTGDVWTIPAERMKGGRQHRVPLSRRARELLAGLPVDDSGFIFPGPSPDEPISNRAMRALLKAMCPEFTVHGFRSSFSDWARERTNYPRDVVEMALAHAIRDKTEEAYRRMDALPKRALLMEEWATFCASPAIEATVTPIGKRA